MQEGLTQQVSETVPGSDLPLIPGARATGIRRTVRSVPVVGSGVRTWFLASRIARNDDAVRGVLFPTRSFGEEPFVLVQDFLAVSSTRVERLLELGDPCHESDPFQPVVASVTPPQFRSARGLGDDADPILDRARSFLASESRLRIVVAVVSVGVHPRGPATTASVKSVSQPSA